VNQKRKFKIWNNEYILGMAHANNGLDTWRLDDEG